MAKLIFILDGNVIKEYALDKDRIAIGRRPSNDVHIDNLAVSGEHAEIITTEQETYIQDLNSTNGTLVNNKPIKKHVLQPGDVIGLGKYELKFVKDVAGIMPQSDGFADTVLVEPDSLEHEVKVDAAATESIPDEPAEQVLVSEEPSDSEAAIAPTDDAPLAEVKEEQAINESEPQMPRLKILEGDNAGGTLMLDKSMVKVGQPGQQIAVVTKRQDGYFITHVAGDHYPVINGKAIGAQA
jgi:pSer/pThr/pTyr-binding forkhead associated (FHA) protein